MYLTLYWVIILAANLFIMLTGAVKQGRTLDGADSFIIAGSLNVAVLIWIILSPMVTIPSSGSYFLVSILPQIIFLLTYGIIMVTIARKNPIEKDTSTTRSINFLMIAGILWIIGYALKIPYYIMSGSGNPIFHSLSSMAGDISVYFIIAGSLMLLLYGIEQRIKFVSIAGILLLVAPVYWSFVLNVVY